MNRRVFLRQTGLAASAVALVNSSGCRPVPLKGGVRVLDTHTHFYDPTRPQGVPWPPRDDGKLYRRVLPEEFSRLTKPLDVAGTVVVEASAWEEDNQWVLDLADREPVIVGLVGHLKPGRPRFGEYLERFGKNPRFRGIRTGLWDVKIAPGDSSFVNDLQLLSDRRLTLDLLVGPNQLEVVAQLATRLPDLVIVVDHCANVPIDGGPPPATWLTGIRSVARHPNVHMKVSGLVEGTARTDGSAPWDLAFYRPVLDTIWNEFGEARLCFGSNWPVSARFADYATVLGIARSYFVSKGERALASCLRDNACRIYGVSA